MDQARLHRPAQPLVRDLRRRPPVSAGAIAIKGLNLGIDFKGGTQINFSTPQPTPLEDVRSEAAKIGQGGAYIQGKGDTFGTDRYKTFQIRTESLAQREQGRLTTDLTNTFR